MQGGRLPRLRLLTAPPPPPPLLGGQLRSLLARTCSVEHKMRKGVSVRDVYKVGKTIGTGGACFPAAAGVLPMHAPPTVPLPCEGAVPLSLGCAQHKHPNTHPQASRW